MKSKALVLGFIFLGCGPFLLVEGAGQTGAAAKPKAVTIDDYVKHVMEKSDRALTLYNDYQSSVNSYKVTYRQTRMPQANLDSTYNKSKNDTDSDISHSKVENVRASLAQPLYFTGGTLSADVNADTSIYLSSYTSSRSDTQPSYNIRLNQPLYLFKANSEWRTWHIAEINYQNARDMYAHNVQQLENEAKARYYDVLLQRAQVGVEKSKVDASKRANDVTKALVDAGRLAGIDYNRSNVRLQSDLRRIQNAETGLERAINDAFQFASLKRDTEVVFTSTFNYTPVNISVEALIDFALIHRPDYLAAQRSVELARLSLQETLETNNPNISATAGYGHTRFESSGDASLRQVWEGGLQLKWLFFDSSITNLNAKSARNNVQNQEINVKNMDLNIRTEVSNAYLELKRTEAQLGDLLVSIAEARESVTAVRIRYQHGRDRLLDVFDSEQELRNLELEYLNVILTALLAKDRLEYLIGGRLSEVLK